MSFECPVWASVSSNALLMFVDMLGSVAWHGFDSFCFLYCVLCDLASAFKRFENDFEVM